MDISLEAIEEQWAVAQANAGTPRETAALMRAQILATLLAAQPPVKYVMLEMSAEEAAAWSAQIQHEQQMMHIPRSETGPDAIPIGPLGVQVPFSTASATDDDDFFAEAKAARKKK